MKFEIFKTPSIIHVFEGGGGRKKESLVEFAKFVGSKQNLKWISIKGMCNLSKKKKACVIFTQLCLN